MVFGLNSERRLAIGYRLSAIGYRLSIAAIPEVGYRIANDNRSHAEARTDAGRAILQQFAAVAERPQPYDR
jgi:hypothetical protein